MENVVDHVKISQLMRAQSAECRNKREESAINTSAAQVLCIIGLGSLLVQCESKVWTQLVFFQNHEDILILRLWA